MIWVCSVLIILYSMLVIIRKFAHGGHLERFVTNGRDQQTVCRLAGHNRRSTVSTFAGALARIQQQATLQRFLGCSLSRVARVTMLDEDRSDLSLEELNAFVCSVRADRSEEDGR